MKMGHLEPWIKDFAEHPLEKYSFRKGKFSYEIKRTPWYPISFYWLGYIHLPRQLWNIDLETIVSLHGGITYDSGTTIGFDTCHAYDLPGRPVRSYNCYSDFNDFNLSGIQQEFRSFAYVKRELEEAIDILETLL